MEATFSTQEDSKGAQNLQASHASPAVLPSLPLQIQILLNTSW